MSKFKEGNKLKTTVYMSVEDVGQDIPIGSEATVFAEPSDNEDLVGVFIDGTLNYSPQYVFK